MRDATREVARFIVETPSSAIPSEAFDTVRWSCFDVVGVALAGSVQPVGQTIQRYAQARGGNSEATIIGSGLRLSAPEAALTNGTLSHALDFDDFGSFGHPTVGIFPAVLAAGELVGASGKQLLEAYIIGFEVGYALNKGGNYNQYERGFHSTAVFGTMAAAAGASRMLGLTVDQTMMAIGIAASEAGGVGRNNGTMTKPFHAGLAARAGVTAALLAQEGFTAAPDILEAKQGFCETFLGENRFDLKQIIAGLGNPFKHHTTVMIKKYPCCGSNHSALDAVLSLVHDNNIAYDDVEKVQVQAMKYTSPVLRYPDPPTGLNAKFSIHHTVAAAILDGEVRIDHFTDECARSQRMQEARAKIEAEVMARWDPRFMYAESEANPVVIHLKDGTTLSKAVERHDLLGSPRNRWSEDALKSKFRANALCAIEDEEAVDLALETWFGIDTVENISEAISTICVREGATV